MDDQVIIGIDIGGTKSAVVLARTDGEILHRLSEPTRPETRRPEAVLERLAQMAREVMAQGGVMSGDVRGVGISCGGPLDTKTGTIYAPPNLPGWSAVPVKRLLEEALGLPVVVENDANATALAEWKFGAGRGARNLIFMTMGTGIGGGLILDGRLYRGTKDLAGEVGHQTILMNGPLCGCGKRGCLEALASGPAIARLARESMMYGRHKRVLELAGGKPANITAAHVVEAAKEGDAFARQILQEAGTYMGVGIANLIQILNPERVILGTIAVHAGDLILEPIRSAVAEYAWERSAAVCQIVPAALGDRAQDLAAVALLLQEEPST
ncbi:MAG TPA: ROK family protein [Chthonomonadaceae bacterium]|nr:ROK family protein [Chthonomonadaceae bacterium]